LKYLNSGFPDYPTLQKVNMFWTFNMIHA